MVGEPVRSPSSKLCPDDEGTSQREIDGGSTADGSDNSKSTSRDGDNEDDDDDVLVLGLQRRYTAEEEKLTLHRRELMDKERQCREGEELLASLKAALQSLERWKRRK